MWTRPAVRDLLSRTLASSLISAPRRWRYLAKLGMDVRRCTIEPASYFGSRDVAIGPGSYINRECFFDGSAPIRIGRNCSLAMRVVVATGTHRIGGGDRRSGELLARQVSIGDGCWVGACVVLLPGVTVGEGCVIAAGSVVTEDCAPHGLYAGVPARRVKDLPTSVACDDAEEAGGGPPHDG
ncbi:acyltransferase [Geodermatophilus marinus]|uniref:acyltransferase n=1 Tax=Geodermatophilus sp. LHW52908 TaxID=2303986 RepID=UPI000E3DE97D|nr:acyltransferase [Geodermatophilus sp. LHW52908]RFU22105.1 acyltransferase [Geodermatophilus sp. LHW52908]